MNAREISEQKGTWYAITSGLLYGLLGYFGVSLMRLGFSVPNLAFWRFFSAFIFLCIVYLIRSRRRSGTLGQRVWLMITGGVFYGLPGCLFFISSRYIGTGQAMVIFFVFPLFVMLLNRIIFKQAIRPQFFVAFFLILCGLILLVDIGEVHFDLLGIGLSLLSALSYAIYIVSSKRVAQLPALFSSLLIAAGCSLTLGTLALFDGSWEVPTQLEQWMHVVGIGIVCSALPVLLLFEALKHIPSDKAALLAVLEPVFVVIVGVLLLDEVMRLNTVFGIILTLAGAMSVSVKMPAFLWLKRKRSAR